MVAIEVFEQQFLGFREVEASKNELVENLIHRVKDLEAHLRDEKLHVEREQEATKSFQTRLHSALSLLDRREQEISSNSFVSVLLDGDCMLFLDHLVVAAEQGGMDAARILKTAVSEYVSTELKLPVNIQVRIRVYANMKGLTATYCHHDILGDAVCFQMFIRGFNMGNAWCDFVDAGDGKECADAKVKVWFNHDLADVQCQAVLFGGSADNGYARLLQPFAGDESKKNRIVLVEGPPFAKELAGLTSKFLVGRFPDVFRSTKLSSRRVSISALPFVSRPTSPVVPSYAKATGLNSISTVIDIASGPLLLSSSPFRRREFPPVQINHKGQRLDSIINPIPNDIKEQRKKLCNAFHILGECAYTKCAFPHGVRLEGKGIEARQWIARQALCQKGFSCRGERCLFGHQCPDKNCARVGNGCRFSKEMHNVDRTLV